MCFNQLVGLAQPAPAIVAAIPVPGPLAPMAMLVAAGLPNALMSSAVFVDGMPGVELPYASTAALLVALNQAGVVIVEGQGPDGSAQVGIGAYTTLLGTTGLVTAQQATAYVGRLGAAADGLLLYFDPKNLTFLDPGGDRPPAVNAPRAATLPLVADLFRMRLDLIAPEVTFAACLALVDANARNVPAPAPLLASSAVLRHFAAWLATTFPPASVVLVTVVGGQQPCYFLTEWLVAVLPAYNDRLRAGSILHQNAATLSADTRCKLLRPLESKVVPPTYWAISAVPPAYASVSAHAHQAGAVELLSVNAAATLFYHYFSPALIPDAGLVAARALVAAAADDDDDNDDDDDMADVADVADVTAAAAASVAPDISGYVRKRRRRAAAPVPAAAAAHLGLPGQSVTSAQDMDDE